MKIKLSGRYLTRQVWLNDKELLPDKSQKVLNHSPDGFSWGYTGSGCSQLALAILLEVYPHDKEKAARKYMQFKFDVIANLPGTDFNKSIDIDY